MKLVQLALKEKGLQQSQISEELQNRIINLKELQVKYNEACDMYDEEPEKNEETETELDKMEDYIASLDEDIANEIKKYTTEEDEDDDNYDDDNYDDEPAPVVEVEPAPNPEPKKKEGGLGWLIFGGLALVATLGAVNLIKKR